MSHVTAVSTRTSARAAEAPNAGTAQRAAQIRTDSFLELGILGLSCIGVWPFLGRLDRNLVRRRSEFGMTPPQGEDVQTSSGGDQSGSIIALPGACGGIGRRARLRALSGFYRVEVRVLSGAFFSLLASFSDGREPPKSDPIRSR